MKTATDAPSYKGFLFPQEIIAHALWLYYRFNLSYRDVEELLAARGVIVTYETVRQWSGAPGRSSVCTLPNKDVAVERSQATNGMPTKCS